MTIHAVNDHFADAVLAKLPDPVAAELEAFDALSRTKQLVEDGVIPRPADATIEEKYDESHWRGGHDPHNEADGHGHGDDQYEADDHHHDSGMLDHGFMIPDLDVMAEVPANAEEPTTISVTPKDPAVYQAMCTVHCGFGHAYQRRDLIRVTDNE